ncbi:hypothetical protein RSSM_05270 [Rhodopirellula sallentina SM41]|uniref:Uncharacterized protein n=2 Tax=Rhodopirellula TaxID=265488 RepID=M5TVR8_9BACT|nr:hypothetical protein RSSM_05270 [Rhodopirellula sallentina SM41]
MDYVGFVLNRAGEWLEHWIASIATTEEEFVDEVSPVEFVGGPLDGYEHAVSASKLYHLPPSVLIPISVSLITHLTDTLEEQFSRVPTGHHDLPRSFASYDLEPDGARWRYRFSGHVITDDVKAPD